MTQVLSIMAYREILDEWDAGCFYTTEHQADAFLTLLARLPLEELSAPDPRLHHALVEGYRAFLAEGRVNPLVHTTYTMALHMLGGAVTRSQTRSASATTTTSAEPSAVPSTLSTASAGTAAKPSASMASSSLPASASTSAGPSVEPSASTSTARSGGTAEASGTAVATEEASGSSSGTAEASDSSSSPASKKRSADPEVPPSINILESRERYLSRFKTTFREEVVSLSGLSGGDWELDAHVTHLFDTLLERQRQAVNAEPEDRCIVEIRSSETVDKPVWFSLRRNDQLNGDIIVTRMSQILNSNESFLTDGTLQVSYIHIPYPKPGGKGRRLPNELVGSWIKRKVKNRVLFDPQNSTDSMCLTRCVAALLLNLNSSHFLKSRLQRADAQNITRVALELCQQAGFDPSTPCDLEHVRQLQHHMTEFRLVVFDDDPHGKNILYSGPVSTFSEPRRNLHLLLHQGHFYAILSVTGAYGQSYFCEKCLILYSKKHDHKCHGHCWRCFSDENHDEDSTLPLKKCTQCLRYFAGDDCFTFHQTEKVHHSTMTTCETYKFCPTCSKSFCCKAGNGDTQIEKHKCGMIYCTKCKSKQLESHLCYMIPWTEKKLEKKTRYMRVYFDIETTQSDPYKDKNNWLEHKPNLLISHQVCQHCEGVTSSEHHCSHCGDRENIFSALDGDDNLVVHEFLDHLQQLCSEKKTVIHVYAHNAKSFDSYFILNEALKRKMKPQVVLQGAKIISIQMGNIHFKDSLLFMPQKLSQLPKAFGFKELRKGYFPHLFNRKENYNYEGEMPDKDMYCTSSMAVEEKKKFETWYTQQKENHYHFKFQYELITYCQSDVDILRRAMEEFRLLFMDIGGFDPLFNCLTLSSACMAMFRRNHLIPYTIGIPPQGGYRGRDKQSFIALQWLDYLQHTTGLNIQTAENGREVTILGKKVDGYSESTLPDGTVKKTIYNFHGCYFHACIHCYKTKESRDKLKKFFGEDRYEKTRHITTSFVQKGYEVIEMWECQFKQIMKHDEQMNTYFKNHPDIRTPPLRLRDALCGGRTSAYFSYKKADLEKGEKILFYDVCSEYPYVNFKKPYPYGHPTIYLEHHDNIPPPHEWNGVIKATVLPPQDLYVPVLPFKCNQKLMFPLCRTCAETQNQDDCTHPPTERQFVGTFCAPELKLALSKGYQLIRVHEVYQYPGVKVYDPHKQLEGLFSSYVQTNMTLKYHASGWPAHIQSDADKHMFIDAIFKNDGITLDQSHVEKNPGKRFLAKLILNSFWGKMGEKNLRNKTVFIHTYGQLIQYINDTTITIESILPLGDDTIQLVYRPVEDSEDCLPTTSLVHAAFTTAHGRMVLYKALDLVDERGLYHDTDSICFLSRPGWPDPVVGSYLGDLTDQLSDDYGPGSFITEFVSGGAKNYAYKVAVGGHLDNIKTVIKVRGISINSSCTDIITFDHLKTMVLGAKGQKREVNIPSQITRLPGWTIVSRPTQKTWQVCLNKRRRIDKERTVPYGFTSTTMDNDDMDLIDVLSSLYTQQTTT